MGQGPHGPVPYGAVAIWVRGHRAKARAGTQKYSKTEDPESKMLPGDACKKSHLEPYVSKEDFQNFDKICSKFLQGQPSHLALPCLAYLASHRPRSPCLHLATTARPPSAAGRRGAPLLLLLVQARRARPMRGEVSQARPGLVHTTHVFGD